MRCARRDTNSELWRSLYGLAGPDSEDQSEDVGDPEYKAVSWDSEDHSKKLVTQNTSCQLGQRGSVEEVDDPEYKLSVGTARIN